MVDIDVVPSVFDENVWHVLVGGRYVSLISYSGSKDSLLSELDPDTMLERFSRGEPMWDTQLEIINALS